MKLAMRDGSLRSTKPSLRFLRQPVTTSKPSSSLAIIARDVGGIVLAVGVHGDDDSPRRGAKAGVEGRRLPGVATEEERLEVFALAGGLPQELDAAVAAAVVDGDDLVLFARRREHRLELVEQRNDVLALVVDGKDDADVHFRMRPSTAEAALQTGRRATRNSWQPTPVSAD